jgi:hypothetical protein
MTRSTPFAPIACLKDSHPVLVDERLRPELGFRLVTGPKRLPPFFTESGLELWRIDEPDPPLTAASINVVSLVGHLMLLAQRTGTFTVAQFLAHLNAL